MKARYAWGFGALGIAVIVAGATAAYSADGLPEFGTTATASPAPSAASPAPSAESPSPSPSSDTDVSFAVAGDSITAWPGKESGSWTSYAGIDGVEFSELGWAQNGARLDQIEAGITPVDADVLVVLAGTNDLSGTTTLADRLRLVDEIVDKAGAREVVIAAVPPFTPLPQTAIVWNAALRAHAAAEGYTFVEPWATSFQADGTFAPAMTLDGVHPTPRAAAEAGVLIGRAIAAAAAG